VYVFALTVRTSTESLQSFAPYLSETCGQLSEYTTLSHCWAEAQIITTTKATFLSRMKQITWMSLSKTFQDAIIITHKLGLRFIWIDSLCIIQDDILDWETESKKMASIYESSKVTIAAAKSHDGKGGCFVRGRIFPVTDENTGLDVFTRQGPSHHGFEDDSWFNRTTLPLFSRAWTFQEELLATRVLYYCPEEIVFQCKTKLDCQCGNLAHELSSRSFVTSKQRYNEVILIGDEMKSVELQWCRIVRQYSARHLTKEKDRLPALSGLTGAFKQRGLGNYVAGLWSGNLPLWLSWTIFGSPLSKYASAYVAPSWSWASILSGTQVLYVWEARKDLSKRIVDDTQLRVLDVYCEPAGLDPSGAITWGYISILGRVVEAKLIYKFTPSPGQAGSFVALPPFAVRKNGLQTSFRCDCQDRVVLSTKEGQHILCLLTYSIVGDKSFFLVLIEGDDEEYRRIGLGDTETVEVMEVTADFGEGDIDKEVPIMDAWFRDADIKEVKIV
jgi:hypothetical protein